MKSSAYVQMMHESKSAVTLKSVVFLYVVVFVGFGFAVTFSALSFFKVRELQARVTELENTINLITSDDHKNAASILRPVTTSKEIQDDIYDDYENDYKDKDNSINPPESDPPYRFTLGDVLVDHKDELIENLQLSRAKRDLAATYNENGTESVTSSSKVLDGNDESAYSQDLAYTSTSLEVTAQNDESVLPTSPRRKRRHRGHNYTSVIAVHFSGDTSKYIYGRDSNFKGNGHLRHPSKVYVDWKQNDWSEIEPEIRQEINHRTKLYFHMRQGVLKIKESGLYFLYAQIYFLDAHDTNGFRMVKNSATIILQCIITTPSHTSRPEEKGNTCYTAGAEYLTEGDEITVSDLADNRYSKFEPGNSFFGAIKLM